jgi:uncharacterized protein
VISFDTNIVFAALESSAVGHAVARKLLDDHRENENAALCELIFPEIYALLRNPAVCRKPLKAGEAVSAVQSLRHHPFWRLVEYTPRIADELWFVAARSDFACGRIYDARLALTLRYHGVTELATRNVKDFQGFGFKKVWDPLA